MSPIPLSDPLLGEPEKRWLTRCIDSGYVSSVGPLIGEFERQFAAKVGARYAVATACGTAALHVALRALGIGRGHSVIVPDLTFVASMNPVLYCGAEPALLDVDRDTWCLDARLLEDTCRLLYRDRGGVKAIIPVHLYGCPCDMAAIRAIAAEFGIAVIEDATEALGTMIHGRAAGTWGDLGCFSFNGNKLITTGAGGMVVTDSPALAEKVRYLVNQARDSADAYQHSEMGYNYRLSNLAAAMGLAQLERFDSLLAAKRAIAARYREALERLPMLRVHPEPAGSSNCFWLYSIVLHHPRLRDVWLRSLNAAGIQARRFFTPLHRQPYVRQALWRQGRNGPEQGLMGRSDRLAACGINLPSSANLSRADQQIVIDHLLRLAHADVAPSRRAEEQPTR